MIHFRLTASGACGPEARRRMGRFTVFSISVDRIRIGWY
jgi:hypothetical protein